MRLAMKKILFLALALAIAIPSTQWAKKARGICNSAFRHRETRKIHCAGLDRQRPKITFSERTLCDN